jgi:hypothetical protein
MKWREEGRLLEQNKKWWCEWSLRNEHDHTDKKEGKKPKRNKQKP